MRWITSIQSYHKQMGYYPPDNTNNNTQSSLFYELTGTTNKGTGISSLAFLLTLHLSRKVFARRTCSTIFRPWRV